MTMSGRKSKPHFGGGAMEMDDEYQERMQRLRDGLPALENVAEERAAYSQDELRMIGLLERARTILGNMAAEREGFWNSLFGRRWPINHEPLRNDARHLLPLIDAEIEGGNR